MVMQGRSFDRPSKSPISMLPYQIAFYTIRCTNSVRRLPQLYLAETLWVVV